MPFDGARMIFRGFTPRVKSDTPRADAERPGGYGRAVVAARVEPEGAVEVRVVELTHAGTAVVARAGGRASEAGRASR